MDRFDPFGVEVVENKGGITGRGTDHTIVFLNRKVADNVVRFLILQRGRR